MSEWTPTTVTVDLTPDLSIIYFDGYHPRNLPVETCQRCYALVLSGLMSVHTDVCKEVVRSDESKPNRTRPIPGNPYGAGIVDCTEVSDE